MRRGREARASLSIPVYPRILRVGASRGAPFSCVIKSEGRDMIRRMGQLFGGYAFKRQDLRLLYATVFLSFLGTSVAFPLRLLYAQAHQASPAELGVMAAAFLIAPLAGQPVMGWLVDRWGRVPVLMLGLVSHVVLCLFYIFFTTPLDLIALRFLEGLTVSAVQPAISAYIADVTPAEHRSEAYGALSATLNAGMFIGPLVGGVIGQSVGFTAAFWVNVAIEALAVVLVWGRIHEPPTHTLDQRGGATPISVGRLLSLPLLGAYAAFFTTQMVMGIMGSLWSIWVRDLGGSYTYIGATFTVFALPQILFGTFAGRLGDRWGRAPLVLVAGLLVSVIYAAYGTTTNLTLIMILGIAEGLFLVFQQPVVQGLLADASPAEARGRVQGIAGATGAVGGALAAFASLPLYHASHPLPFTLAGLVMALGSVLAAAGALAYSRQKGRALRPPARADAAAAR